MQAHGIVFVAETASVHKNTEKKIKLCYLFSRCFNIIICSISDLLSSDCDNNAAFFVPHTQKY